MSATQRRLRFRIVPLIANMRLTNISTLCLTVLGLVGSTTAWTNPVRRPGGSDPFVTYSGDGYYYLMSTSWTDVRISRSTTVAGLKTAESKVIYTSTEASRCCNVWAPEVHWLGDRWYVYFTAGNGDNLDGQRMHVLEGTYLQIRSSRDVMTDNLSRRCQPVG